MYVVIPVFNTPHTNEVEYLCLSLYNCTSVKKQNFFTFIYGKASQVRNGLLLISKISISKFANLFKRNNNCPFAIF